MKSHHAQYPRIFTLLLITFLASITSTSMLAQQPGPRIPERRETPRDRLLRERTQRQMEELQRRSLESLGKNPVSEKSREKLLYDQIREDFQQLQVINNQMMHATFESDSSADLRLISKALGDIFNRASRLRSNLKLPKTDDEEQKQTPPNSEIRDIKQLKASLLVLDDFVMSFIENPMFKNPNVVDVTESAKAQRDLEGIIGLSWLIKKAASKLPH